MIMVGLLNENLGHLIFLGLQNCYVTDYGIRFPFRKTYITTLFPRILFSVKLIETNRISLKIRGPLDIWFRSIRSIDSIE